MEAIQPKIYITSFEMEDCLRYVEQLNAIVQTFGPTQLIVVHIESYGGTVEGFFIIHEALTNCDNPIVTYTTGMCASAGLFLFTSVAKDIELSNGLTGKMRIVGENAQLMFHGIQTSPGYGDIEDIKERVKSTDLVNTTLLNIAAKAVGLDDGEALKNMVRSRTKSHDLYLGAKEAVELGFADHIGAVRLNPVFMYDVDFKLQVPQTGNEELDEFLNDPENQQVFHEQGEEEFVKKLIKKKKKSKKGKKK